MHSQGFFSNRFRTGLVLVGAPLMAWGVKTFLQSGKKDKKPKTPPRATEEERKRVVEALEAVAREPVNPSSDPWFENRRAARMPCCLPVDIDASFVKLKGFVTQVGFAGVELRTDRLIGPDTELSVRPKKPAAAPLGVRVRRSRRSGRQYVIGAEFQPGAEKVDWLIDLLALAGADRERRKYRRLEFDLKVEVKKLDGSLVEAELLDLSPRGAGVRLISDGTLDHEVRLNLPELGDGSGLTLGATVINHKSVDPRKHLQFLDSSEAVKKRINAYLEKLNKRSQDAEKSEKKK